MISIRGCIFPGQQSLNLELFRLKNLRRISMRHFKCLCTDHHQGNDAEGDILGDVDVRGEEDGVHFFFFSAPASSAGASGTVSIHSPNLVLSCSRSAILGSLYSYSGLQNSASNGHTSTQMPQYMHRA